VWVHPLAQIRENATGEVREYVSLHILDSNPGWPSTFIWSDGNYACDCNRRLFFEYAVGRKPDEIETECTDDLFSVNLLHPQTRTVFYREFD
jgi:hypothetical protein